VIEKKFCQQETPQTNDTTTVQVVHETKIYDDEVDDMAGRL
jgi:hypothetical protein